MSATGTKASLVIGSIGLVAGVSGVAVGSAALSKANSNKKSIDDLQVSGFSGENGVTGSRAVSEKISAQEDAISLVSTDGKIKTLTARGATQTNTSVNLPLLSNSKSSNKNAIKIINDNSEVRQIVFDGATFDDTTINLSSVALNNAILSQQTYTAVVTGIKSAGTFATVADAIAFNSTTNYHNILVKKNSNSGNIFLGENVTLALQIVGNVTLTFNSTLKGSGPSSKVVINGISQFTSTVNFVPQNLSSGSCVEKCSFVAYNVGIISSVSNPFVELALFAVDTVELSTIKIVDTKQIHLNNADCGDLEITSLDSSLFMSQSTNCQNLIITGEPISIRGSDITIYGNFTCSANINRCSFINTQMNSLEINGSSARSISISNSSVNTSVDISALTSFIAFDDLTITENLRFSGASINKVKISNSSCMDIILNALILNAIRFDTCQFQDFTMSGQIRADSISIVDSVASGKVSFATFNTQGSASLSFLTNIKIINNLFFEFEFGTTFKIVEIIGNTIEKSLLINTTQPATDFPDIANVTIEKNIVEGNIEWIAVDSSLVQQNLSEIVIRSNKCKTQILFKEVEANLTYSTISFNIVESDIDIFFNTANKISIAENRCQKFSLTHDNMPSTEEATIRNMSLLRNFTNEISIDTDFKIRSSNITGNNATESINVFSEVFDSSITSNICAELTLENCLNSQVSLNLSQNMSITYSRASIELQNLKVVGNKITNILRITSASGISNLLVSENSCKDMDIYASGKIPDYGINKSIFSNNIVDVALDVYVNNATLDSSFKSCIFSNNVAFSLNVGAPIQNDYDPKVIQHLAFIGNVLSYTFTRTPKQTDLTPQQNRFFANRVTQLPADFGEEFIEENNMYVPNI